MWLRDGRADGIGFHRDCPSNPNPGPLMLELPPIDCAWRWIFPLIAGEAFCSGKIRAVWLVGYLPFRSSVRVDWSLEEVVTAGGYGAPGVRTILKPATTAAGEWVGGGMVQMRMLQDRACLPASSLVHLARAVSLLRGAKWTGQSDWVRCCLFCRPPILGQYSNQRCHIGGGGRGVHVGCRADGSGYHIRRSRRHLFAEGKGEGRQTGGSFRLTCIRRSCLGCGDR